MIAATFRLNTVNNTNGHTVHSVKLGWTRVYLLKCTGDYLLIDTDIKEAVVFRCIRVS